MAIYSLLLGLFMTGLVGIEGLLAYRDRMFLPSQMMRKGHLRGLPAVAHGGLLGDIFIINPLLMVTAAAYGDHWSLATHWKIITAMWVATVVLHIAWAQSKDPDCLAWNGRLEPAGWVHFFYMGIALSVFALLYFGTPHVDPAFLITATALLALHVSVGNQVILSAFNPHWWGKNTLKEPLVWIIHAVSWGLMGWRCYLILKKQG